ncbi:uncharacterized protein LOC129762785 isoform X2 [Toxorhynchites rutilus septentrionalis]|uniref:uncharacterized protein LOC129762785 isoform X2 n=1 Tax=Toxorhynchites rutilus septentrionalis TaxID=329112 RepID=UPI00247A8D5B|nr:uncharacterized protein LOC129762785 isoform X2 [Toxorhynchites rutilus septentrionalis]
MKSVMNRVAHSALVLVSVFSVTSSGWVSHLDVLKKLSEAKGNEDLRSNLRSIRKLAIQHGLIKSNNDSYQSEWSPINQRPAEFRLDITPLDVPVIIEGRKKGVGVKNSSETIAPGGKTGIDAYGLYDEVGDKKSRKRRKKHRKKHRGWKRHMKKMLPYGLGILALKMIIMHFILKKLALATALSLFLSKKSLLVSALIALKLMLAKEHHHEKNESSKLEKINPQSKSQQKSVNAHHSNHPIKHTHQQMEDFGGKYIPLGYESNHYHYDLTTQPSYLDSIPEASEDNYLNADDLQFVRRDGWDGWTGWNRGDEKDGYSGGVQKPWNTYKRNASYDIYNSHGNGGFNRESFEQSTENIYANINQSNYKQRNLSQMKYRRKRRLSESP